MLGGMLTVVIILSLLAILIATDPDANGSSA
jgi:hypothetical protein